MLDAFDRTGIDPSWPPPPEDYGSDDWNETTVLPKEVPDDSPTTVQLDGSMVYVVRVSTGARIDMMLPVTMGRGSQASCLVTGNRAISRTHARITCDAHGYQIENISSTNGVSVAGVAVPKGGFALLEDGMTFALADEEFTFHKVQ